MKLRVLLHSLVCVLGLGIAGIATATYIITDDIVNPHPDPVIYPFGSTSGPTFYSYELDITDNGWLSGGSLVSASLTILLRDFTGPDAGTEYFRFVIGLSPNEQVISLSSVNSNPGGETYGGYLFNVASLADLNSDGKISVKIESREGNSAGTSFMFDRSTLVVTAGSGPVGTGPGAGAPGTVPEPSVLLLLCLGFAMLIWSARRGPVAG